MMRHVKSLILALVFIFSLFFRFAPVCFGASGNHLVIGSTQEYPPFSWKGSAQKPTGFLIEITEAVARAARFTFELQMDEWNTTKQKLLQGKIDAIDGMFYSIDRDREFDFSEPHSVVTHSIFVWQEDKNIHSLKDLQGRSVIAIRGDIMHEFLLEEKIGVHLVLAGSLKDAVELLALHRGEAAVVARMPALYYMKELGINNVKEVGKPIEPTDFCFAVKESNGSVLAKLNEGLAKIKATGEYDQIKKKWFEPLEPRHDISEYAPHLVIGAASFLLVIVLLWVWNWTLQREVRVKTEALKIANEKLRKIDEFKTNVVHTVAHEVRAPLGVMQGYLDYLAEGALGDLPLKQKEILQKIQGSVDRMNRLVADLLDMSKIEAGRLELQYNKIDANELAREISLFFQNQFESKGISFEIVLEPPAIFFEADRDRIEQCLINLVGNAIKHTPSDGKIELRIKDLEREVQFEIHDTGEGIHRKNLARLFQKFETADTETKGGYGLGLVITKGLVELHRGNIWVESKEGRGSLFAFRIPKLQMA